MRVGLAFDMVCIIWSTGCLLANILHKSYIQQLHNAVRVSKQWCMFLHRQLKEVEQWNREADGLDLLAISYQIHSTGDNIIYSLTCSRQCYCIVQCYDLECCMCLCLINLNWVCRFVMRFQFSSDLLHVHVCQYSNNIKKVKQWAILF